MSSNYRHGDELWKEVDIDELNVCDGTTTDENGEPIEDETYVLSEKMCFCSALYDAGLFNEYDFFGDLFDEKTVARAWELFKYRMERCGLLYKENKPDPKDSVTALDVLKGVLRDARITDREDYRGDETAETVLDFFAIMLIKHGYDVS